MNCSLSWSVLLASLIMAGCSKPTSNAAFQPKPAAAAFEQTQNVVMAPETQKQSGVEIATLQLRPLPELVHSTARLTNDENNTWRVGAITEGRIVSVLANVGDYVQKDQILARMHSHDIHEGRAEYSKARANLARAKGAVEFSTRIRDRAKRLYELKAGSLEQLERAETELRNAQIDVNNAQVEVERTRNHLTEFLGVDADDPNAAQPSGGEDLDLIPVRAPASGVILARNVTPGTVVTSSTDQFLITDLSIIWAIAEVREEYLGKLRAGMPVRVYVQAYGSEPFEGYIGKIGDVLDPATRTIKVRVELPNRRKRLKPEMYATAEIDLGNLSSALMVPAEAVQEVRGHSSVFVQTAPDSFEVHPVQAGRAVNNAVEITGAVKPGDRVVVKAAFVLKSEFLKASLTAGGE